MIISKNSWIHNIRRVDRPGQSNIPYTMPTIRTLVDELSIDLSALKHYSMIGQDSDGLSYIWNPWQSHEKTRGFRIPEIIYGTEFIRHNWCAQWNCRFTAKSYIFDVVILDR